MFNKKSLLFIVVVTMLLASCKQKEPEVIQDSDWKFFAVCCVQEKWVSRKLYNEVVALCSDENYTKKDFENLKVLIDDDADYEEKVTGDELYNFFVKGKIPQPKEETKKASEEERDLFDIFFEAMFKEEEKRSKSRALEMAYEICGDFFLKSIKADICNHVKVYEYRKDKEVSTKKVSVYDVVYLVSNIQGFQDKYIRCTIEDRGNGDSSIKYVNASTMYSDLYNAEVNW